MSFQRKIRLFVFTSLCVVLFVVVGTAVTPISTTYLPDDVGNGRSAVYRDNFERLASDVYDYKDEVNSIVPSDKNNEREKIVQIALGEVGVMEEGYNNVKYNDWYNTVKPGASPPGTEWCAIFDLWLLDQVGLFEPGASGPPSVDGTWCPTIASIYHQYGRFVFSWSDYEPRPGDLVYLTSWNKYPEYPIGYSVYHTGIVVDFDGEYLYTVEGNSGGESGSGVHALKYKNPKTDPNTVILGYAVPWYSGEEEFYTADGETF